VAKPSALGASVLRREGAEKLTGRAIYVDDLPREGVWWGGTVRSREPHARLRRIARDPTFPWDEVVVVTADDIPGENVVALIFDDQPALVPDVVRHAEEAVALVAAPDPETLARALAAITVETDPLPAVFDVDAAFASDTPIYPPDNLFKRIDIEKGSAGGAMDAADEIVTGEYTFGSQEHVYIEPQGMEARWEDGAVTARGSLQCPYYVVAGLARLLDLPAERVRVVQNATGGGFGGKEEYPTMLAAHAALLSRKAGRPVRIVYDRVEDMRATTKRHPGRVRHRTGLTRDGRLVAMEIDIVLDGGAYCTLSPVVLSRGAIHAAGPYDCDHIRIVARAVATNRPPFGAFRGFGAPQTLFAVEAHLDKCAEHLGIDPVELRRRNLVRPGGTLATGQNVGDDVAAAEVLDRLVRDARVPERRREFHEFNRAAAERPDSGRFRRRGIGLALFHHGAGFTGSGEVVLASEAGLRGNADGTVTVLSCQTEIGQGTRTVLAQAAAEGIGIEAEHVRTEDPDTAAMPNSGPTVASRTGMVVGGLLIRAGREFRRAVEEKAGRALRSSSEFRTEVARQVTAGALEIRLRYEQPYDMHWDEERYRGDAYASYSWGAYAAAVEVDVLTGEVRVLDVTAVQEVGRVINPVLAAGQIEGGVAQGIGWALLENIVWQDGRMMNATMTDYIVPTAMDTPPIRVVFLEHPHPRAPHGAKGIGELPMDGPAPAIVNALRAALGRGLTHVPAIPERVLAALAAKEGGA
jgi:CO/xanthine dehydrogenase Mo-binding subunit